MSRNSRRAALSSCHRLAFALFWVLGAVCVLASSNARLTSFGLGLMAPGGGLAYYGHWPELVALTALLVWLAGRGEWSVCAYIWFAIAAVSLSHSPHPGHLWQAATWVIPVVSVVPGLVWVGWVARRARTAGFDHSVGQGSSK
ncbi:hypothetical protein [Nocardia coubleae]|uniref:Uncharacterized protein n=1 Tax=Nocardia coubleae TaxID=356147 RepID=A0A846W121_9NOCA|nr:hypothetical protein [Nocardia coubleae]NKX86842.1 hypothetical protein [Nocardia coubleae]